MTQSKSASDNAEAPRHPGEVLPAAHRAGEGSLPPNYFARQIFFCLNERKGGEECCAQQDAQTGFERCKSRVKALGLAGAGKVRVNKAGCLDRCAGGPVAVVYPEGVWYSYVDQEDIDEIVATHLQGGKVVERLLLPPDVGR